MVASSYRRSENDRTAAPCFRRPSITYPLDLCHEIKKGATEFLELKTEVQRLKN